MTGPDPAALQILRLAAAQEPGRSICPTDAARALAAAAGAPDWHAVLPSVRRAAARLAREGRIEILRKGKPVDPAGARGVIRLRIAGSGP